MKIGIGCRVNGVKVFELGIKSFPDKMPTADITYALGELEETAGKYKLVGTHGKATATHANLSEKTKVLLTELLEAIEEDMLLRHFGGAVDKEDQNAEQGLELGGVETASQI